jgi:hypothetical protein
MSGQIGSPEVTLPAEAGELHKKSIVNVFAIEDLTTKTSEDHVTGQGFGYSSPLEKPMQSNQVAYRWEGMIHPTALQAKSKPEMIRAYNVRDTLQELAENFAQQYREHQDSLLQANGESSYAIQFAPTQEQVAELLETSAQVQRVVRGLKPDEQEAFMSAFAKANAEARSSQ